MTLLWAPELRVPRIYPNDRLIAGERIDPFGQGRVLRLPQNCADVSHIGCLGERIGLRCPDNEGEIPYAQVGEPGYGRQAIVRKDAVHDRYGRWHVWRSGPPPDKSPTVRMGVSLDNCYDGFFDCTRRKNCKWIPEIDNDVRVAGFDQLFE